MTEAFGALAAAAAQADGVAPISEQTALALRAGASAHTVHSGGELAGFAYGDGDSAELVVAPAHRRHGLGSQLLAALRQAGQADRVWAHGRLDAAEAFAAHHHYRAERVLWQLRRPPAPVPDQPLPAGITVRAFRPGQDEADWLRVNARAFADHPEQGGWSAADLAAREAEPWFDPAGFLLAYRDGRLVGFHWTKIHPDSRGEVYVLGLDPIAQGTGLAVPLTVAGLTSLQQRGAAEMLLYVDESNVVAAHLYAKLGFQRFRADVQFVPES